MYYAARTNGNNNVYLIPREGRKHLWLLNAYDAQGECYGIDPLAQEVVLTILAKHDLMTPETGPHIDLTPYQPDPEQFKEIHDELVRKEKNYTPTVGYVVMSGIAVVTLAVFKYGVLPLLKTFFNNRAAKSTVGV